MKQSNLAVPDISWRTHWRNGLIFGMLMYRGHLQNWFNSLRPRPNRRYFADDIFKCIFENENEWILHRISLKFVPKVRINNIPVLVQIMAWCRPGDKPLSKPVLVCLLTHICVTRPQWVNFRIVWYVFGTIMTSWKGQNLEFPAIFWGTHDGVALNLACWCALVTLRTD